MPVRPSMQPLIDYLKHEGNASSTDIYEGVTYWTNQQLQDILDRISERKVAPVKAVTVSGLIYNLDTPRHYYFDPDTVVFLDENLDAVVASYTYDLLKNEFTFVTDPEISYVQASFIHFWNAVAELWSLKATHRFQYVDNRAGQNFLKSHQEYEHCIERMQYYRNLTIKRWKR